MAAGIALVRDKVRGRNTHTESIGNHRNIKIPKSQINTSLGEWGDFFFHLIAFNRPPPMVIIHRSLSLINKSNFRVPWY